MKSFFQVESKTVIKSYKNLLSRKLGVRLDQAPSNKPSTIKRKGRDHWFKDSGKSIRKGFSSVVTRLRMVIFASKEKHPNRSDVSYEKLFLLHNTADGRYSGVFGQLPVGSKMFQRLDKEVNKQVQLHIAKKLPKRIYVGKR